MLFDGLSPIVCGVLGSCVYVGYATDCGAL